MTAPNTLKYHFEYSSIFEYKSNFSDMSFFLLQVALFSVTVAAWIIALLFAIIQMYVVTGGIFYDNDSGVCYTRGRIEEVIMRSTLHYHLPSIMLVILTTTIIYFTICPSRAAQERDIDMTSADNPQRHTQFDPWDRFSTILVSCTVNACFLLFWFPETYFYIKGNLYVLTWGEIKAFIGSVYLFVFGKGLIVVLWAFGVKDTRDILLFRKRSPEETQLLGLEDVPSTSQPSISETSLTYPDIVGPETFSKSQDVVFPKTQCMDVNEFQCRSSALDEKDSEFQKTIIV